MNPARPLPQLQVAFSLHKADTLDVIEAVLAIARRGGLQLQALQLRSRSSDDAAFLALAAPDTDLLDLFLHRLHNVIGVHDIDAAHARAA